jgi:hypothetical protein
MRLVILIILALSVNACARPTGDFGRAKPGIVHDEILPTIGKLRALIFEEPVSGFNWTDQEVEMHDRAWRFLTAPHTSDWFYNVLIEWQRTRILPRIDTSHTYDRYYNTLRWERYRSSRVRYNRLTRDIDADIATIPGVLKAICAVVEVDRQRRLASGTLASIGPKERADMRARNHENQTYIDWFTVSARYRYESYNYALEHLLAETPHEEARRVDARLSEYAIWVERAEAEDYCSGPISLYGGPIKPAPPRSRMYKNPLTPDPNYRK